MSVEQSALSSLVLRSSLANGLSKSTKFFSTFVVVPVSRRRLQPVPSIWADRERELAAEAKVPGVAAV